jgi:hypothetical protein
MKQLFHLQSSGMFLKTKGFQNLKQSFQHGEVQKSTWSVESHPLQLIQQLIHQDSVTSRPIDKVQGVFSYQNKFSSNINLRAKDLGNRQTWESAFMAIYFPYFSHGKVYFHKHRWFWTLGSP